MQQPYRKLGHVPNRCFSGVDVEADDTDAWVESTTDPNDWSLKVPRSLGGIETE